VAAILYFTVVYFLTKVYGAKNYDLVGWMLLHGGAYTTVFWIGWVLIGGLIPLGIIYHPVLGKDRNWIAAACGLVILGGLATMYVVIIGGQAYPLQIFPGQTVLDSGSPVGLTGAAASYTPSLPELLLGVGGVAVALIITAVGVRVLQFLPESLADAALPADEEPTAALAEAS
jgi:molybdopterin-containing oxidoreductase family membrane subunit